MDVNSIQKDIITKIKSLIRKSDYTRNKTDNERKAIQEISNQLRTLKQMKKPHIVVVKRTKAVRINR
jgi:uncharacterized membrane protein